MARGEPSPVHDTAGGDGESAREEAPNGAYARSLSEVVLRLLDDWIAGRARDGSAPAQTESPRTRRG